MFAVSWACLCARNSVRLTLQWRWKKSRSRDWLPSRSRHYSCQLCVLEHLFTVWAARRSSHPGASKFSPPSAKHSATVAGYPRSALSYISDRRLALRRRTSESGWRSLPGRSSTWARRWALGARSWRYFRFRSAGPRDWQSGLAERLRWRFRSRDPADLICKTASLVAFSCLEIRQLSWVAPQNWT